MRHGPIDGAQIAAMQEDPGNRRMKGRSPPGQGALRASAMPANSAPAMGKRMARKNSGSACGAESLATTKPVAHITTKSQGAAKISHLEGAVFMQPSFALV